MANSEKNSIQKDFSLGYRGLGVPSGGTRYSSEQLSLVIEALLDVDREVAERRRALGPDRRTDRRENSPLDFYH